MINKISRAFLTSLVVVLAAATGLSQTAAKKDFSNVKIENFGQMDERFYRGARPEPGRFTSLKELGVKTIIDLSDEPRAYEKDEVEALAMKYIYMPIVDKAYPTPENVESFLKIVDDPETGVFFVHCGGGKHRTGDMGALYRFEKYGWNFDQVYKEMKDFDFYSSWGHGKQKDFVIDYAKKYEAKRAAGAGSTASAAGAKTGSRQ
ncbi:MAG: hypothetical protein ABR530_07950 [Pyrinomonadaceae bacterium]